MIWRRGRTRSAYDQASNRSFRMPLLTSLTLYAKCFKVSAGPDSLGVRPSLNEPPPAGLAILAPGRRVTTTATTTDRGGGEP